MTKNKPRKKIKKPNPSAKALASGRYRQRRVESRKVYRRPKQKRVALKETESDG
ncbi:MAG: hypothetical protein HZA02_06325 [Nitrospinae bacterium]|nr:hypothetical protein [Nitrospinota bacterium]